MRFNEDQAARYSRNITISEVGIKGQEIICDGKVLIVGAGGLGSPVAYYLAAAGVGTICIIDDDVVDLSNLQRQILHTTGDIGRAKADSAWAKLTALNPDCKIIPRRARLTAGNALEIIKEYDAVVDGTDNFTTRFLINDACVMLGKPFFHGGVLKFFGQALTIIPGQGPCYRCIFGRPPVPGAAPTCAEAGVLGVLAGIIGVIQATEVLKYLLGLGDLLVGRLLTYDALSLRFDEIEVKRNSCCPVCGDNPTITELKNPQQPGCTMRHIE